MQVTPKRHGILAAWPASLFVTIALGASLPAAGRVCALWGARLVHRPMQDGFNLPYLYAQHGFQLVFALIWIGVLRRIVPADYGLHWPRGPTYLRPAILWGVFFGFLMNAVGFAPELWAGRAPVLDYRLSAGNVAGWLGFEGLYVGPTEEIPFRALMVTYLASTMRGQIARVGRYSMNQAGVIVALMFALSHATSFWTVPWPLALGQQLYAFALGVLYAYWLEKSGSVLAPAVGHNVSDGTSYCLMFLWVGLSHG
jgi:hypothetical protein